MRYFQANRFESMVESCALLVMIARKSTQNSHRINNQTVEHLQRARDLTISIVSRV